MHSSQMMDIYSARTLLLSQWLQPLPRATVVDSLSWAASPIKILNNFFIRLKTASQSRDYYTENSSSNHGHFKENVAEDVVKMIKTGFTKTNDSYSLHIDMLLCKTCKSLTSTCPCFESLYYRSSSMHSYVIPKSYF
jgi:hypothetical protein